MAGGDQRGEGFEARRIAQPQRIFLKPASAEDYTQEYLVDLSMTGMFVRCMDPPAPGTLLHFKMKLSAGSPVARGSAEVVWRRQEKQRLSHPPGMGLRFTELDAESRKLIQETVQRYSRGPDGRLELQNLRSVVEETLGEILGPTAASEAGGSLFTTAPVSIADLPIPPDPRSSDPPSPRQRPAAPRTPAEAQDGQAPPGPENPPGAESSSEPEAPGGKEESRAGVSPEGQAADRAEARSWASEGESDAAGAAISALPVQPGPGTLPGKAAAPSRRWWLLALLLLLGALAAGGAFLLG